MNKPTDLKKRSLALDVFRGMTVALMILVNNPGSWSHIYAPLQHASWHGLTPTDLVFPFFLFAVGNAQALVFPAMWERQTKSAFFKKVIKRSLIIFFIGLFLNWYPFVFFNEGEWQFKSWDQVRIMGVLQRIAITYFASAFLTFYFPKKILTVSIALLIFYWVLCLLLGSGDVYSLEGWFGTRIDRFILGDNHLYKGEGTPFDPEGLMSTISAIAQVMLGFWAGIILNAYNLPKSIRSLTHRGLILIFFGCAIAFIHPINKKIWSSSYVLVTSSLAMILLAFLVQILDVKKFKSKLAGFFEVFGKNPLFIFVLSGIVPRTLSLFRIETTQGVVTPLQWFYLNFCTLIPGPKENGSLLYAILLVGLYGIIATWLNNKKIYIKV
jgi:predicted acyltransferase